MKFTLVTPEHHMTDWAKRTGSPALMLDSPYQFDPTNPGPKIDYCDGECCRLIRQEPTSDGFYDEESWL